MDEEVCHYCILAMCFMCENPTEAVECCCDGKHGRVTLGSTVKNTESKAIGRPMIEDGLKMKNAKDAGRARALDVAPIPEDYECEWMGLAFAGGGVVPIIGCSIGLAHHRHHGPDKGTLVNTVGVNLHRVCDTCHNRWHALNDPFYSGQRPPAEKEYFPLQEWVPHDRKTLASTKDQVANQRWWNTPIADRSDYRSWTDTTLAK